MSPDATRRRSLCTRPRRGAAWVSAVLRGPVAVTPLRSTRTPLSTRISRHMQKCPPRYKCSNSFPPPSIKCTHWCLPSIPPSTSAGSPSRSALASAAEPSTNQWSDLTSTSRVGTPLVRVRVRVSLAEGRWHARTWGSARASGWGGRVRRRGAAGQATRGARRLG